MPIFKISVAGKLEPKKTKELYTEVAKVIAKVKGCPIEAVSGEIHELPLYAMGSGNKDWETILEEEVCEQ